MVSDGNVLSAWHAWFDRDPIAHLEVLHRGSYLDDRAGTLMAQDDGGVQDEVYAIMVSATIFRALFYVPEEW